MVHINELPPEIIREIIHQATNTPDASFTHFPSVFAQARKELRGDAPYIQTLPTKLSILLVNKVWNRFGLEKLYEDVRIVDTYSDFGVACATDPVALARAYAWSSARSTTRTESVGWWTKHLQVPSSALMTFRAAALNLVLILQNCHRLESFEISGAVPSSNDTMPLLNEFLSSKFANTLIRVQVDWVAFPDPFQSPAFRIRDNLLALSIVDHQTSSNWLDANEPIVFPNITNLCTTPHILTRNGEHMPLRFPSLQQLTLQKVTGEGLSSLKLFFTLHGSHIRSLCLTSRVVFSVPLILIDLQPILQLTPNLHEILYHMSLTEELLKSMKLTPPHPKVTHVGLLDDHYLDPPYYPIQLVDCLAESFPKLECVRLLVSPIRASYSRSLLTPSFVDGWLDKGVRLEDMDGRMILEGEEEEVDGDYEGGDTSSASDSDSTDS